MTGSSPECYERCYPKLVRKNTGSASGSGPGPAPNSTPNPQHQAAADTNMFGKGKSRIYSAAIKILCLQALQIQNMFGKGKSRPYSSALINKLCLQALQEQICLKEVFSSAPISNCACKHCSNKNCMFGKGKSRLCYETVPARTADTKYVWQRQKSSLLFCTN